MLRYLKVHIQNRKKKWSTAETAADHFALHGSSLALTFYSPFCRGDTLIYMDLCEPKSFELFKIWRYMDIYEDTLPMGAPSIPNFICTHSPSIFLDFQGVSAFGVLAATPFLHHFRIWLYWIGKPHAHRVLSDQVIHLRSPQHRSHALCLATRCADIRCFHSVENHDAGHRPNIGKAHSVDDETDKL